MPYNFKYFIGIGEMVPGKRVDITWGRYNWSSTLYTDYIIIDIKIRILDNESTFAIKTCFFHVYLIK